MAVRPLLCLLVCWIGCKARGCSDLAHQPADEPHDALWETWARRVSTESYKPFRGNEELILPEGRFRLRPVIGDHYT